MILQSFKLGNLASLYMRIINSVVVIGLYYGFITTFSIGPSYLLLVQAHIKALEEGEKEIEKEVSAATGFLVGQLLMFVSVYYTPLHLALSGPHTITFLVPCYLLLLYYWYNFNVQSKSTRKHPIRNPNNLCIFLNNLIFQLLNHFFFPSSMLARLVNIYMFRYNNKMLFVTSSFVGWLIGQILFMKWVRFVLVWLQQNYLVRAKSYIYSNKYLFYVFRFYRDVIFDLRTSMNKFSSILVFFTCLCTFGRMPLPLLTYRINPEMQKKKNVELKKNPEEEEKKKRIIEKYYGKDISQLKIDKEESQIPLWFDKPLLTSILFDYNRWNRPMRHIRNLKFLYGIRNEMSQFYFGTCPNDGKLRISFSCPPSLVSFWKMIERKIYFFTTSKTENFIYDELYDYWIYTNENKMKSLRKEFSKRIEVLDKKGLEKINVLENKIRLCKDKKKKEYLPSRYDPFLNGSYRGKLKEKRITDLRTLQEKILSLNNRKNPRVLFYTMLLPIRINYRPMLRQTRKKNIPISRKVRYGIEDPKRIKNLIKINKIQIFLGNDYSYYKSEQKIDRFFKKSLLVYLRYFLGYFVKDTILFMIQGNPETSLERKELMKQVPHWLYKLFYDTEEDKIEEEKKKIEEEKKKIEKQLQEERKAEGKQIDEDEERKEEGKQIDEDEERKEEGKQKDKDEERKAEGKQKDKDEERKAEGKQKDKDEERKAEGKQIEEDEEEEENEEEEKKKKKKKVEDTDTKTLGDISEIEVRRTLHLETLDEEGEIDKQVILSRYVPGPQMRDLIKGSVRAQKRKSGIWLLCQTYEHSRLFLNRTDSLFNRFVRSSYFIKGIFLKYMRKISEFELSAYYPSFADLFISIEESGEQESRIDAGIDDDEKDTDNTEELEEKIREAEQRWECVVYGHVFRCGLLFIQLIIRRVIILPLLIIAKNIGRILLLQRPELLEDFKEYDKERYFFCTYNGIAFSEFDLPETWMDQGIQIKVLYPFRLKPWHRSRPSDRERHTDFFYLTTWGLATYVPFGPPEAPKIKPFFKPIFKKLYKIRKKIRKHFAKWIFYIQKGFEKRLLKKNLSNVNPNFEFELRDKSSEIIKENDSIINNQMIHESSIESQFKNLTNYSLTQKRMKDLANRRSTIRNKMDKISKIVNISPNKKHYGVKRLESLQNFVQILKRRTARLIRKSGYFIEFFMEKIYVDLFLYIFNISRIYTQKFFLELKKKYGVYRTNRKPIPFILTIKKSHFLFSSLLSSKINKNSRSHSDLSFLSQAYVFYKISQAQLSNLYKLRSVFKYYGTSLFLKNEIKDYFGAQGIIHSELRTKKLPNSGMNQWKNWLKSNYQYGLSQKKWSELGIKKRRNKINKYCRGKNNKKKCNSYEKEQLINSNYQNAKAPLLLLLDEQENWKKNLKFEVLSYKFLFHEDKKDLDSYRIPFQGNKNKELSYTKNYYKYFHTLNIGANKPKICQTFEKLNDFFFSFFEEKKKIYKKEKIINKIEKEIEKKEKEFFFYDKKKKFCDQISQKGKLLQFIKRFIQKQKTNFFYWMGMNEENEELLRHPLPLHFWFFPEFILHYDRYKKKPWTIPIDLLFSTYEDFTFNRKKKLAYKEKVADKKKPVVQNKLVEHIIPGSNIRKLFEKKKKISREGNLLKLLPEFLGFQLDWLLDPEDLLSNIDIYILLHNLNIKTNRVDVLLSFIKKGAFNLDIMLPKKFKPSISNLLKRGVFFIEPIRVFNIEGSFITYQMTGLSWVRKNLKHPNYQKRFGDENNYDLLIPENILLPRRRRELRILSLLNSRNNKGVDKNPVYCNGNRVNKGSQFFDKSKDLDRDKKKLIKFFLWPNYRLEDLACMNRYWFDTNNGSRFSILRIRMYPRLKTHL
uniref:Protein TIC 214 n=1 Tax=Ferocactus latispinus TaxID=130125 RepID=A0A8A6L0F6_9CARY|nr:hypothetical chloroplast RF1 [Ferocactus latispinus]